MFEYIYMFIDAWIWNTNINRDETKLQPFGTRTKQHTDSKDSFECEDYEDPDDVYAVYRGKLTTHSFHLIDFLNAFGDEGGFDAIIERLSHHEPMIDLNNLSRLISTLSKVSFIIIL